MKMHGFIEPVVNVETAMQKEDFCIVDIDRARVQKILSEPNPPHRHDYQEIIGVMNGRIVHNMDGQEECITAPAIVVVPQGRIHQLLPDVDFAGWAIRFHNEYLPESLPTLLSQVRELSFCKLTSDELASCQMLVATLRNHASQCGVAHHLLMGLLEWVQTLRGDSKPDVLEASVWARFESLLELRFMQSVTVGYYANEIGASEKKLNEIVRAFAGITVGEAIERRRILEAKRLLRLSPHSLKEVAHAVGFEDHSYFTKVFRKQTGHTPTDYRAHL